LYQNNSARQRQQISPIIYDTAPRIICIIAGLGAGGSGCFISPRLRHNWRFRIYLHSFGVSQKDILAQGDGLVGDRISDSLAHSIFVSKAVLLALDGVVDANGNLDTNRT
jgi:hypothetical protein